MEDFLRKRRWLFYLDGWRRWRIQNRVQSSEQKATGTPVPSARGSPVAESIVIDYRARKLLVNAFNRPRGESWT